MNLERTCTIREVQFAIEYANTGGKILESKLDYYRRELAEDSRYKFKFWDLLADFRLVFVEYRGCRYLLELKEDNESFDIEELKT